MPRILLIILLWTVQACVIALLVNGNWVQRELQSERAWVNTQYGARQAAVIEARARDEYRNWFVATGWVQASYSRLLPDPGISQHGMEGLAPWFFKWLEYRLVAFWWLIYQAIYRLELIRSWVGCCLILSIAAGTDGLVRRQVARSDSGFASSDRYLVARRLIAVLGIAPFLYLCLPFAVTPWVIPCWGVLFALGANSFATNIQHRI